MKTFECSHCGNTAYFDNTVCVRCGMQLAYDPDGVAMVALRREDDRWLDAAGAEPRHLCANAVRDACNWLVGRHDPGPFCRACRHNRTVPDLSRPRDVDNWRRIEVAKRHLFYSLMRWGLPLVDRTDDPQSGLAFDFLADVETPGGTVEPVLTGHDSGLITINIAEGDDAERERRRQQMGEPYRTLLGHFRHEIGHYYWDRLVRDGGPLDACRALFGDEREDYAQALRRNYTQGPRPDWPSAFVSSYASAHPWEDFAETWAHYLHIVDTLETASEFGMTVQHPAGSESVRPLKPYFVTDVTVLLAAWTPLSVAINAVNRSMGQPDLYPFVLSDPVVRKLQFICDLVRAGGTSDRSPAGTGPG